FHAQSFMAILRRQIEEEPEPPSRRAPANVTPELDAVVLKALAKDRDARYANMKELALALAEAGHVETKTSWSPQEDAPPAPIRPTPREPSIAPARARTELAPGTSPPPGMSQPPARSSTGALIAVIALLAMGGAAWLFWPKPVEKPAPPPVVAA